MKLKEIYVISMPIGLGKECFKDITVRGLEKLKLADAVIGESFPRLEKILDVMEVSVKAKTLFAVNRKNEKKQASSLTLKIAYEFESVALISDAGVPAIGDIGYYLLKSFRELALT